MQNLSADDPRTIGPYTLTKVLGEGGMGRVYLGHKGGVQVAIKVILTKRSLDLEAQTRFRREIMATRKVASKRIAKIIDVGTSVKMLWYASEHVAGPTLQEFISSSRRLTGNELAVFAAELHEGHKAIAAAGIVHRDIKPSNIIMGADGVKIVDFGIAFMDDLPTLTREGITIGTPGFMCPEQMDGNKSPNTSWDVFAYGCVLVYAATGNPPFRGGSPISIIRSTYDNQPILTGLPAAYRQLAERCLQKDQRNRATLSDISRLLPKPAPKPAPTRVAPKPGAKPVLPKTKLLSEPPRGRAVVRPLDEELPDLNPNPLPIRKPVRPSSRSSSSSLRPYAIAACVVAFLVAAAFGFKKWDSDFHDTTNAGTPTAASSFTMPKAQFTAVTKSSSSNPSVTNVQVGDRSLKLTFKLAANGVSWKDITTKSCLVAVDGKERVNNRPEPDNDGIDEKTKTIIYWTILDYPGTVLFYASCPKSDDQKKGGLKLGTNKVDTPGSMTNAEQVLPIISSSVKEGKLQTIVRQYIGFTESRYKNFCLKTSSGLKKPVIKATSQDHENYVILTFEAKAGTLYMECSGTTKISYKGTGVKLP